MYNIDDDIRVLQITHSTAVLEREHYTRLATDTEARLRELFALKRRASQAVQDPAPPAVADVQVETVPDEKKPSRGRTKKA